MKTRILMLAALIGLTSAVVLAQPAATTTYTFIVPGQIGKGEALAPDGSCTRFFLSDTKTLAVCGGTVANGKSPQLGFVTPNETFTAFTPAKMYVGGSTTGVGTFTLSSKFTTMYASETEAKADSMKLTKTKATALEKELTTLSAKDELKALKDDIAALKKDVELLKKDAPEGEVKKDDPMPKKDDPMPKKEGVPMKKKDIDD
ncbi:MAG: hypothetical protein EB060_07755 [Proteobacteria bacterium]|nr:hypothetical protein [Pseudomonadota bacterium]